MDLGFGFFRDLTARQLSQFARGDIVETRPFKDPYKIFKTNRAPKDLFTYRAYIEKVIDGDTLKVRLDLGFASWKRETLRLRGIDCPELDTPEGRKAKVFVQSCLKDAPSIIVYSSRSDKYDRYLADIFIPRVKEPDPATDIYLNNLLLETGHAKRV